VNSTQFRTTNLCFLEYDEFRWNQLSKYEQESNASPINRASVGINVQPDTVDFNKELDEITAATNNPHGLQMWRIGWFADYPDPQDWLTLPSNKQCRHLWSKPTLTRIRILAFSSTTRQSSS
jgi:ABC-type oligopeptide transport system substrate-binding subunit